MKQSSDLELWVRIGTETAGPFSRSQIREMLRNGEIQPITPCAVTGASAWSTVAEELDTGVLPSANPKPLAPGPPYQSPARRPRRFALFAICLFVGGLVFLWAGGVMDSPSPYYAYGAAEKHVLKNLPAGSALVERDYTSKNDPWYESESGVMCYFSVKRSNPNVWTDWRVWMKRRGRWWVIDSVKQEERPLEYMSFKVANIKPNGSLSYSVNKFPIYSMESLLNGMAYFGWEPAPNPVIGEVVFRRPKNSGPYTSFSLEFDRDK